MREDSSRRVEILSRTGKATGKYQQAYNIRNIENGNLSWVDLKDYETEEGESESTDIKDEEEET